MKVDDVCWRFDEASFLFFFFLSGIFFSFSSFFPFFFCFVSRFLMISLFVSFGIAFLEMGF